MNEDWLAVIIAFVIIILSTLGVLNSSILSMAF